MPPAANSQQAMSNLQNYTNSMQSPDQIVNSANQQFGVQGQQQNLSGLRQSIENTTNLLNNVAPSVMGRTANSLVTSAQANRQIANEQAPLNTQFNKEQTDYSNANSDYQNSLAQAEQLANAKLTGQTQQQSYLQGIYNDLYTQEQNAAQLAAEKYAADASVRAAGAAAPRAPGGGSSGGSGYGYTTDQSGGFQFSNNGKPITAMQYVTGLGGGWQDLMGLLSNSKNPGDKQIAQDMALGIPQQSLLKKYPYVFGAL